MTLLGNRGDKRHFAFYGEYHSHMTGCSARREAESLLPIRSRNWRKGDTHMRIVFAAMSSAAVALAGLVSVLVSESANAEYGLADVASSQR